MCGIAGAVLRNGDTSAFDVVMKILIRQSELGYGRSSTGVCAFTNLGLRVEKDTVNPKKFSENMKGISSNSVIGHIRMPSVGEVTIQNAHPFRSCDKTFALLHNGNEHGMRTVKDLMLGNHEFEGETDSEVIMHIMEEHMHNPFDQAVRDVMSKLPYSTILIMARSGMIYGMGSRVVIVNDKNGVYIASTSMGLKTLFEKQRKTIYETNDLFTIDSNGNIKFYGEVRKKRIRFDETKEGKNKRFRWLAGWIDEKGYDGEDEWTDDETDEEREEREREEREIESISNKKRDVRWRRNFWEN